MKKLAQLFGIALVASLLVTGVSSQIRVGNFDSLVTTAGTPWATTLTATVTLTDAQIKLLPTTPFPLVAAPGANLMLEPFRILLFAKCASGAYTNINAAGNLSAKFADGTTSFSFAPNDAAITAGSATRLTDLLGTANYRRIFLQRYFDTEGVDGWGPVDAYFAGTAGSNSALQLFIDNVGSGALTGGNAANTIVAITYYTVVTVP